MASLTNKECFLLFELQSKICLRLHILILHRCFYSSKCCNTSTSFIDVGIFCYGTLVLSWLSDINTINEALAQHSVTDDGYLLFFLWSCLLRYFLMGVSTLHLFVCHVRLWHSNMFGGWQITVIYSCFFLDKCFLCTM